MVRHLLLVGSLTGSLLTMSPLVAEESEKAIILQTPTPVEIQPAATQPTVPNEKSMRSKEDKMQEISEPSTSANPTAVDRGVGARTIGGGDPR